MLLDASVLCPKFNGTLLAWMMLTYSQHWSCRSCTWTNWIVVWWCATQLSVLVRKVLWATSHFSNERNCQSEESSSFFAPTCGDAKHFWAKMDVISSWKWNDLNPWWILLVVALFACQAVSGLMFCTWCLRCFAISLRPVWWEPRFRGSVFKLHLGT